MAKKTRDDGLLDSGWQDVQNRTFTKWFNSKLSVRAIAPVEDLSKDLSDGIRLIQLLEIIGDESLGRYNKLARMRVQKAENVAKALDFIKMRGVQFTNIGPEDIMDGNLKLILGLIWTLILRFTIAEINEEGLTAKEGLLLWCQRKTAPYREVDVQNFSTSWRDGLAFCALIHRHRPDLLDYDALDKDDWRGNTQLAFGVAAEHIGIPQLLEVEDVVDVEKPDERSVMTYVAQYFHAFSALDKVETAGRRVENFIQMIMSAWEMQSSYESRMRALLSVISSIQSHWSTSTFDNSYADAKKQSNDFNEYKKLEKREWVKEKTALESLLGNIQTKLRTYGLKGYEPPEGLGLGDLDGAWRGLLAAEAERSREINGKIRAIKEQLRRDFADKANEFSLCLNTISLQISSLHGSLEDQRQHVATLRDNITPLEDEVEELRELEIACIEANIEENDYTVYTYDDLEYELALAEDAVAAKLAFIENQIIARNMTNMTPAQLEEFESVFRHFDRDHTNVLERLEFNAALASLGLVYPDDEMESLFLKATQSQSPGTDYVTFEQFIRFMVDVTEDQNSPEQVLKSFRDVADGKEYVTEMDLRHSLVEGPVVEFLGGIMPRVEDGGGGGEGGMDYLRFMEAMVEMEGASSAAGKLCD
ncbi:alpha-actinin [Saitoella coloradoensis]